MLRRSKRDKSRKRSNIASNSDRVVMPEGSTAPETDSDAKSSDAAQQDGSAENTESAMSGKSDNAASSRQDNAEPELTTANVEEMLKSSSDIVFRKLHINGREDLPVTMVFIDGVVDKRPRTMLY